MRLPTPFLPQPNSADLAHAVSVGRVAAASLAFSGGGLPSHSQTQPTKSGDPPSLPRRGAFNAPNAASLERVGIPGAEVDKLVTKKASSLSPFLWKAPDI